MKTIMQKLIDSKRQNYDYSKYGRKRGGKLYPIVRDGRKSKVIDTPASDILNAKQLAAYLKISMSTLYKWSHAKTVNGFPIHKQGKHLYSYRAEIDKWLQKR